MNILRFPPPRLFSRPPAIQYICLPRRKGSRLPLLPTVSSVMEISLHDGPERLSLADDDAQSYMDEDDVREVRLHHWLSETESARLMQESAHSRADSPVLGFDHFLTPSHDMDMSDKVCSTKSRFLPRRSPTVSSLCRNCRRP